MKRCNVAILTSNLSRHAVNLYPAGSNYNKGCSGSLFKNDYFHSSSYKIFTSRVKVNPSLITMVLLQNIPLVKTTKTTSCVQHQRRMHVRSFHSIKEASPRQLADLEERVWSAVGSNVKYTDTNLDLKKLGWNHRRLCISEKGHSDISGEEGNTRKDVVQILLQVPTLLLEHLEQLRYMVRKEAKREIDQWASDNNLNLNTSNEQVGHHIDINVNVIPQQSIPWTVQTGQQSHDDVTQKGSWSFQRIALSSRL